jgi:Predicted lipoprotein of unknown function (DUF2380)
VGVVVAAGGAVNVAAAEGEMAASLSTGGSDDKGPPQQVNPGRVHRHHLLPQQHRRFFRRAGIDIDKYTVELGEKAHLSGVHGRGDGAVPGRWNERWHEFVEANPQATADEIFQHMRSLMAEFGLSDLPIIPYR